MIQRPPPRRSAPSCSAWARTGGSASAGPREFGGQGRGPLEQLVFYEEVQRAGAPYPLVTLNTVGPTLMAHGTPEQQAAYLPGILAGEIHFAIGYTEPSAGTDLASLRTRAVRDGDNYVVTGNKVFTSGGDLADFIWLACRTDPRSAAPPRYLDPHRRHPLPRLFLVTDQHGRQPD